MVVYELWVTEKQRFFVFLRRLKISYYNVYRLLLLLTSVVAKEEATNSSGESKAKDIRILPWQRQTFSEGWDISLRYSSFHVRSSTLCSWTNWSETESLNSRERGRIERERERKSINVFLKIREWMSEWGSEVMEQKRWWVLVFIEGKNPAITSFHSNEKKKTFKLKLNCSSFFEKKIIVKR